MLGSRGKYCVADLFSTKRRVLIIDWKDNTKIHPLPSGLFELTLVNDVESKETMENLITERISSQPEICHGKPIIRGMRHTVEGVLELLASGMTHSEILDDYPDLEEKDLTACLLFAVRMTQVKNISRLVA